MSSMPSRAALGDARASHASSMASYADTSTVLAHDDEAFTEVSGGGSDVVVNEKARQGGNTTTSTTIATPSLDDQSPISKEYLTFDTRLPSPAALQLDDGSPIPPCPDLTPFLSPSQWTYARKALTLTLSCIATFLTGFATSMYSPPAALMAKDFHTSRTAVVTGITAFCVGFALTPMIMAPLSEIRGRRPIFILAGVVFALFMGLSSVMPDVAGMIVCRLFAGMGASVFSTVVGGVLADIYSNEERNTPMALFAGSAMVAVGAGPLVSAGMIKNLGAKTLTWKWTFWSQTIMDVVLLVAIFFCFPESRRSVILANKADALNGWYEELENRGVYGVLVPLENHDPRTPTSASSSASSVRQPGAAASDNDDDKDGSKAPARRTPCKPEPRRIRWVVKEDEQRASLGQIISISVKRPFHLLVTEPVVFCFALWASFSWAVLYLSFSIVPYLYTDSADSFRMSSSIYGALVIASFLGTVSSIFQDRLLRHPQWVRHDEPFAYSDSRFWAFLRRRFPAESPEARLYFAAFSAALLPIGLFLALMSEVKDGSYAQAAGFGLAILGIYAVYLTAFNYLADTYHIYASSAIAAQSCCRNLLGGVFPAITGLMYDSLGAKGTGGMLGGVAVVLTLIPWVLIFFGEKIRARSKIALSLEKS